MEYLNFIIVYSSFKSLAELPIMVKLPLISKQSTKNSSIVSSEYPNFSGYIKRKVILCNNQAIVINILVYLSTDIGAEDLPIKIYNESYPPHSRMRKEIA